MTDPRLAEQKLCNHWRPTGPNGGRVLKAEYMHSFDCCYCEIERLKKLQPEQEITEVPIRLMFDKINELAEDMYLSSIITFAENEQLQSVFDAVAARHGFMEEGA